MQRKYPHTVKEYLKRHKITGIVTETDSLWDVEDGKIPNNLKQRTIKDVKDTTVVVY
jgi:hypothetical protein